MFHWYGLIVGVAVVVGWSVAEKIEPKVAKVLPWVLLGGIVGARLYHVIDQWAYYAQNLGQIVAVWKGGLGIFGGIIGGFTAFQISSFNLHFTSQEKLSILGAITTAAPLAQAIGRWGNLVNNELWGRNHEPLFLYESVLDIILFGILWKMRLGGSTEKSLVGAYLIGYGVIRLVLEPLKPGAWWVGYGAAGILVVVGAVMSYNSHNKISE